MKLNQLSPELQQKALNYCKSHHGVDRMEFCKLANPKIAGMFHFSETIEGIEYWMHIDEFGVEPTISLKQRLYDHFRDAQGNYDQEEINNVIEIIDGLNDDLTDINKIEEILILRLLDDTDLYDEVDALYEVEFDDSDLFADL